MFDSYGFIFPGPGADPAADRVAVERGGFRSIIVPVRVARVIEATGGRVPVGSVGFGSESVAGLAALAGPRT